MCYSMYEGQRGLNQHILTLCSSGTDAWGGTLSCQCDTPLVSITHVVSNQKTEKTMCCVWNHFFKHFILV